MRRREPPGADAPLAGFHLTVLPWKEGGVDVRAEAVPGEEPAALAAALAKREPAGLDDRARALAAKTTFVADGNVVRARLQIPAAEVRDVLVRAP